MDNRLIEVPSNGTTATHNHSFTQHRRTFLNPLFVVFHYILGNFGKQIRVIQDNINPSHHFLALLYLIVTCSFLLTLVIEKLYFLHLNRVNHDFSSTTFIDYLTSDLIRNRFGHGVTVYNRAKHIQRIIKRCSRKSYVCSIRKRIAQILGKTIVMLYTLFRYSCFLP